MKTTIKILLTLVTLVSQQESTAQRNLFWGQSEQHWFDENSSNYGVAYYEHYTESSVGLLGYTVFSPGWSKVMLGVGTTKYSQDVCFLEASAVVGYETGLNRPRFGSILFGSIHLDKDESDRKGTLTVMYNPEYGHSFYHFGFVLYNVTDWMQVGAMLQPDAVTGPRVQFNLGEKGSIRPWIAAGYSTMFQANGVSAGMRYKLPW